MNLRFDCYGQALAGDNRHPQVVMRELGIKYLYAVPHSIASQWFFWGCDNVPNPLPAHFRELDADPQEYIGYGLTKEMADSITATEALKKEI